ncbi:hypothetical protein GCM10027038_45250 [Arthrobacter bambusae]
MFTSQSSVSLRIHAEPHRPDFNDRTQTTDDLRLVKNMDGEQWIWVIAVLAGAALVALIPVFGRSAAPKNQKPLAKHREHHAGIRRAARPTAGSRSRPNEPGPVDPDGVNFVTDPTQH